MLSVSTVIAGFSSVLDPAAGSAAGSAADSAAGSAAGWVSYVYVASEEAGAASSVLAESVGGGAVMSAIEIGVKLSLASVFVSMSSSMAEAKVVNEAATSAAANLIILSKITVFFNFVYQLFCAKN